MVGMMLHSLQLVSQDTQLRVISSANWPGAHPPTHLLLAESKSIVSWHDVHFIASPSHDLHDGEHSSHTRPVLIVAVVVVVVVVVPPVVVEAAASYDLENVPDGQLDTHWFMCSDFWGSEHDMHSYGDSPKQSPQEAWQGLHTFAPGVAYCPCEHMSTHRVPLRNLSDGHSMHVVAESRHLAHLASQSTHDPLLVSLNWFG